MYFQRSLVVATMVKAANDRTEFFASVYSFSAVLICLLQLLATGEGQGRPGGSVTCSEPPFKNLWFPGGLVPDVCGWAL